MIFCVVFKEVEVKKEKKTASPGKKRGPDKNLLPNPKIKILEKDPLFETKYVLEYFWTVCCIYIDFSDTCVFGEFKLFRNESMQKGFYMKSAICYVFKLCLS